jgi:hypothetical protein
LFHPHLLSSKKNYARIYAENEPFLGHIGGVRLSENTVYGGGSPGAVFIALDAENYLIGFGWVWSGLLLD